jgi:hypothetical protein
MADLAYWLSPYVRPESCSSAYPLSSCPDLLIYPSHHPLFEGMELHPKYCTSPPILETSPSPPPQPLQYRRFSVHDWLLLCKHALRGSRIPPTRSGSPLLQFVSRLSHHVGEFPVFVPFIGAELYTAVLPSLYIKSFSRLCNKNNKSNCRASF